MKNYRIEYLLLKKDGNHTILDITDGAVSLDELHMQSAGRMASGKIVLNAEVGQFTSAVGKYPILKQFDLLILTVINDDGIDGDFRIMEIVTDIGQFSTKSSHLLPLELQGRERNLAGVTFSGFFRSATHFSMGNNVISSYIRQTSSESRINQPLIRLDNQLPDFNPNIWDFTYVDNCYDAVNFLIDQANLPVTAGGGGDRFSAIYEDDMDSLTTLKLSIISQGSRNEGNIPTLEKNVKHQIRSIHRTKQASTGTLSIVRGATKTGTMPTNFSKFVSKLEFYRAIKQYDTDIAYPIGVYARFNGLSYISIQPVPINTPPPTAQWQLVKVGDFIGDIQYSPWTEDKVAPLINGFSNPTGGFGNTFDNVAVIDSNSTIHDTNTNREWVLFRSNTTDIVNDDYLNKYMSNFGGIRQFVHGTVVLVDTELGPVGGDFIGNDLNGKPFADNIATFIVPENKSPLSGYWLVIRESQDFDQVAVHTEGRTYEWNVLFAQVNNRNYPGVDRKRGGAGENFKWRDISSQFIGNDCFHQPINVEMVDGLIPDTIRNTGEALNDPNDIPYKRNSAIKLIFGYGKDKLTPIQRNFWFNLSRLVWDFSGVVQQNISQLALTQFNTFTTPDYTNVGWWFSFASPYPLSTHNGITEEIGALYGGDVNSLNKHRYFDLFNIRYTPTGKEGWVHDDSDNLSEITGVKFIFVFDIKNNGGRIPGVGDVPFIYWIKDAEGVVWKSQKTIYKHLGDVQSIEIEFGDLSPVYRARTPLGIDNVIDNIILPDLEVNEALFKDKIILQGFQCDLGYDDFGRYAINQTETHLKPAFFDFFEGGVGAVRFEGTIDAFSFVKTPVAISKSNSLSDERIIIPDIEDFSNIRNTESLQRAADALQEIEQWPYEQYSVEQQGITDLNLEDSVYLKDILIPENEGGQNNTVKLACRELLYTSTRDGGLIRTVVLVRKIQ